MMGETVEERPGQAKSVLDGRVHVVQAKRLQEPKDLHVLAGVRHALSAPPSTGEGRRRVANASGSSHPASGAAWSSAPSLRSMSGR